jgi:high-affinity nickel-transport protein
LPPVDEPEDPKENNMLMMRILGPIITFVNKPWKVRLIPSLVSDTELSQMYPVGILFGFGRATLFRAAKSFTLIIGFDTASSIALLAISALGRKRSDGSAIPSGYIIILPVHAIPFLLDLVTDVDPVVIHSGNDHARLGGLRPDALLILGIPGTDLEDIPRASGARL